MVDDLRVRGVITSGAVADAFATVPREAFVPEVVAERGLGAVYRDEALVTKKDVRDMPLSSSSQPALMARMLELLGLQPGQRVLEVGAGTGYNAALMAELVGPQGSVTSIEIDPELAHRAKQSLQTAGYPASIAVGDGRQGWPEAAPYDRIMITACADEIPRAWRDQLEDGGLVELPLRLDPERTAIQVIPVFLRRGERLESVAFTWGGFMPMHGGDGGWREPPAALSAGRSIGGKHSALASITGTGLSALPDAAARKLLASILAGERRARADGITEMNSAQPPWLLIYLLLRIPASRRVALDGDGRIGVGVIHRRSRSLAVVSLRSPWMRRPERQPTRTRWQLHAFGGEPAAAEMERLLGDWRAMQRGGHPVLRITADGEGETLRLRHGWSHE